MSSPESLPVHCGPDVILMNMTVPLLVHIASFNIHLRSPHAPLPPLVPRAPEVRLWWALTGELDSCILRYHQSHSLSALFNGTQ